MVNGATRHWSRMLAIALVVSGHLLVTGTGRAEQTASDPSAFLKALAAQAIGILSDDSLSEARRTADFRRLFTTGFDVDNISRFVLGRHWRRTNAQERKEYRDLFEDFIIDTYARRLGGYSGETLAVGTARLAENGRAVVSSQLHRPEGPPVKVDWRLRNGDKGWRIFDVVVEGVSMALTQRSEFASIINNNGGQVGALFQALRGKTGRSIAGAS